MKIFVRNRQRAVAVDARRLARFAREVAPRCLEQCACPGAPLQTLAEVEVTIVSDAAMADVHQRFMNIAGPTDVITFEHGEIVISAETAADNALEYGVELEREIGLYIIHGLLHLNGHEDHAEPAAARMRAVQEDILVEAMR